MQHKNTLAEADLDANPFVQFARWSAEVRQRSLDAEAMTLATAGDDGNVSSRVVLLKHVDERGFVFYTNYNSRKGNQLRDNPRAALSFYWAEFDRQVRVEGAVVKTTEQESDIYFASRPRGSQLGAWASEQGRVIHGRGDLDARFKDLETTYRGVAVPRPPHWGGYRVIPFMIEFWQGREDRLHDRFRYTLREPHDWIIERLSP